MRIWSLEDRRLHGATDVSTMRRWNDCVSNRNRTSDRDRCNSASSWTGIRHQSPCLNNRAAHQLPHGSTRRFEILFLVFRGRLYRFLKGNRLLAHGHGGLVAWMNPT